MSRLPATNLQLWLMPPDLWWHLMPCIPSGTRLLADLTEKRGSKGLLTSQNIGSFLAKSTTLVMAGVIIFVNWLKASMSTLLPSDALRTGAWPMSSGCNERGGGSQHVPGWRRGGRYQDDGVIQFTLRLLHVRGVTKHIHASLRQCAKSTVRIKENGKRAGGTLKAEVWQTANWLKCFHVVKLRRATKTFSA